GRLKSGNRFNRELERGEDYRYASFKKILAAGNRCGGGIGDRPRPLGVDGAGAGSHPGAAG
ncbi:hypothetical protein, partial [Pseudoramibacter alactolyticus]|uniref:hypothetical protein n=1 Tax=Pseudoramibacter alactolyticus TaxID=113287 RepID=UPI0028EC9A64